MRLFRWVVFCVHADYIVCYVALLVNGDQCYLLPIAYNIYMIEVLKLIVFFFFFFWVGGASDC